MYCTKVFFQAATAAAVVALGLCRLPLSAVRGLQALPGETAKTEGNFLRADTHPGRQRTYTYNALDLY